MPFGTFTRRAALALAMAVPLGIGSAAAGDFYSHNGSTMELFSNGNSVSIVYANPKSSLRRLGVRPGTVLFRGRYSGRGPTGTAYVFRSGCRPAGYNVEGPITATGIYLKGAAPIRPRGSCNVSNYSWNSGNAELNFYN